VLVLFRVASQFEMIAYVSAAGVIWACAQLGRFAIAIARHVWSNSTVTGLDLRALVAAFPVALWLSGAMSTGGAHFGLYFPFALFVLTAWAVDVAPALRAPKPRTGLMLVLVSLAATGALFRWEVPYSWHGLRNSPLLKGRILVKDTGHGTMLVEQELHERMSEVCSIVKGEALLSLPFSFANYYCAVNPWRGFVQTFYDTSDRERIEALTALLESEPPRWVLYQRQLDNLALHERAFNGGKPLPHRDLDRLILQRVESGQWSIARRFEYGFGYDWILVQTHD
jgi:hypothetical protein